MSADNGIYIAKFPDGYRVAYAGAIDNVDYYEQGTPEYKQTLKAYFGKSKVVATIEEAWKEAFVMADNFTEDGSYLEYGVSELGEYELWE